jgi:DNA-binding NtrC family response regulator
MVVCDGEEILPRHLPRSLAASPPPAASPPAPEAPLPTLEQMEREHIARALRATDGHRGQAARMLGISERNLYRKLRDYGLLS